MRNDQLCVCVDARPQPKIAFAFFLLNHAASVTADKLPLLVHFDSAAWQIAEIRFHVIRKRLAGFTNDARDGVCARFEHSRDRFDWCSFTERRED